jgi:hypothetical protein
MFYFPECVADISLFSENSTLAAAFKAIENALETVDLAGIIPNLLNRTVDPDQLLSTVIIV